MFSAGHKCFGLKRNKAKTLFNPALSLFSILIEVFHAWMCKISGTFAKINQMKIEKHTNAPEKL